MLKSLQVETLTVFPKADFKFGENLNIIIGENGSGKSHIILMRRPKTSALDPLVHQMLSIVSMEQIHRTLMRFALAMVFALLVLAALGTAATLVSDVRPDVNHMNEP